MEAGGFRAPVRGHAARGRLLKTAARRRKKAGRSLVREGVRGWSGLTCFFFNGFIGLTVRKVKGFCAGRQNLAEGLPLPRLPGSF